MMGRPKGLSRSLTMGSPLMVMPAATASSLAPVTRRPQLLGPSPEISTTRRLPANSLSSK